MQENVKNFYNVISATMFGAKRPYKCHSCNGAITKPPEEDEHVCKPSYIKRRPKNSKSDKEPYKCEQCDKSYSR